MPLYLASTSSAIRVVTLALSLSLSGLVQLGCLFFPKVYIVLMKPEKNTKELVMTQHRSSPYLPTPATPIVVLNGIVSLRFFDFQFKFDFILLYFIIIVFIQEILSDQILRKVNRQ